jgi:hypothetical protein
MPRETLRMLVTCSLVNRLHSGPLAAWTSAWLGGTAAFDDVLTAASTNAPMMANAATFVRTTGAGEGALDASGNGGYRGQPAPLGEILIAWRQARAQVMLALPVPGDVRGLPGPAPFRAAALDAGQAVFGGGVGVVPLLIDHRPSSAAPTLIWQRYDVDEPVNDHLSVVDAQHDLTEAIRECASALAATRIAGTATVGSELSDARHAGERINLPPGFPPRAVALIAQAERLAAVLALAGVTAAGSASGSAADDLAADRRAETLRPLTVAVRRARLAGYNAAI